MADARPAAATPTTTRCARCQTALSEGDRVTAQDRVFCRSCYEVLKREVRRSVASISEDINYPMALLGAVLGGALGVLVWWGFTVLTKIGFGLVAVAIGVLGRQGAARFARGDRSRGPPVLAVVGGGPSFLVAAFLVHNTFLHEG